MIDKVSPISFQGLKINGAVSAQNMKKLGEFTTATENLGFIADMEKIFNTDIVLNNKLDEITFSHQLYGDLTKYGCPKFPSKDFYSQVVDVMESIKLAIKKAEKKCESEKKNYELNHRGC